MKDYYLELEFATCVYAGISDRIDYEMKYGTEDNTELLQKLVDRYKDKYMVSSKYLYDKLDEYKKKWKES